MVRSFRTKYGQVAAGPKAHADLLTLFSEVEEYFDVGVRVAPGATVVDVGANIGAFSIAAAKRCDGAVTLHCFEPVPPLFSLLSTNLKMNRWTSRGQHHAHNVAISSPGKTSTTCEFYYFRRFPRDSTMDIEGKRREFEAFFAAKGRLAARALSFLGPGAALIEKSIRALPRGRLGQWVSDKVTGLERIRVAKDTLSSILSKSEPQKIDVLKIDVEGAEQKVLAGIDEGMWSRIKQVVIESDGSETGVSSLLQILDARGFKGAKVSVPPSTKERGLSNVLIYASSCA